MSDDRLDLDDVLMLIGVSGLPSAWQQRIINHERFPKPTAGTWSREAVLEWEQQTSGRAAVDESVALTREELEDDGVGLSEDLVDEILARADRRCQCDRSRCHGEDGIHGLPVRKPRLRVFPTSGRWPRRATKAADYGVMCVDCGKNAPWSRWRETLDETLPESASTSVKGRTLTERVSIRGTVLDPSTPKRGVSSFSRFTPTRKGHKPPRARRRP